MITHNTSELKPGMALAKSVYDFHDVLLLKAGIELSSQNIRLLKSWGISEVWISGQGVPPAANKHAAPQEKRIQETVTRYLQAKFEGVLDDPIMVTIMQAASQLITERYINHTQENEID